LQNLDKRDARSDETHKTTKSTALKTPFENTIEN